MSPEQQEQKGGNDFDEDEGEGECGNESDSYDDDNNSIKDELAMFAEQQDPDKEINSCPQM